MVLHQAISTIDVLLPIAKAIPGVGGSLEGALEATRAILKYSKEVKANKAETKKLAEEAESWLEILVTTLDRFEADPEQLESIRYQVEEVCNVLEKIVSSTKARVGQDMWARIRSKTKDADHIKALRDELSLAFDRFMATSQLCLLQGQLRLKNIAKQSDRKMDHLISLADQETLKLLSPVGAARYDSALAPTGCLEHTRVDLFKQLIAWVSQPSSNISIFWLTGMAGTGKSTIAKSFCEQIEQLYANAVLTTFFISKSSAERRDPFRILSTFVYDLAAKSSVVRAQVVEALRQPPDVLSQPMMEQIERLVAEPIRHTQVNEGLRPLIIVIDALDECSETNGVDGGTLVSYLAATLHDLPVKIFVTSRMEESFVRMFDSLADNVLKLHAIEKSEVAADVRRIFVKGFTEIADKHRINQRPWPTSEEIDALVERTDTLMIFATTVLKFIGERRFVPQERLQQILHHEEELNKKSPLKQVDSLYLDILDAASRDESGDFDSDLCDRLRALLGVLCVLREPPSISTLAALLDASRGQVDADIRALASVLTWQEAESESFITAVRVFHPSFRDFLRKRCSDARFAVAVASSHLHVATRCLDVLNTLLHEDICQIRDPSICNSDVSNPDLPTRLHKAAPENLVYACIFWVDHLRSAGNSATTKTREKLLDVFAKTHLLHWIELLSLLNQLPHAMTSLSKYLLWYRASETREHSIDSHELLEDTLRALKVYDRVLESHALQAYHSLPLTMPHCELRRNTRTDGFGQLITPRASGWSATESVMTGHTALVTAVAFSSDGSRVVSGSQDWTVRIWDVATGRETDLLRGHSLGVASVAFASDGDTVASGSYDQTVRIWGIRNGSKAVVLTGHESPVIMVAFSPNRMHLISASVHGDFKVWNSQSYSELVVVDGYGGYLRSLSLVFDALQSVPASTDNIGRVLDLYTNHISAVVTEHEDKVVSLSLFLPTAIIASGSDDRTVRIRDTTANRNVGVLRGHTDIVTCVAFSPDGASIVSGSYDGTARLWDVRTSRQIAVVNDHGGGGGGMVTCVGFSPDGSKIISGSTDSALRIWDIQSSGNIEITQGRWGATKSVVFSSDGDKIISVSDRNMIRIWNAHNGHEIAHFEGHCDWVTSMSFSPNGTQVIYCSWKGDMFAWDMVHGHVPLPDGFDSLPEMLQVASITSSPDINFTWDEQSGWLSWRLNQEDVRQICWIPVEFRSDAFSSYGATVVLGGPKGSVTIFDFSGALDLYSDISSRHISL